MADKAPPKIGGDVSSAGDYLNPEAETLLGKVDWSGMVSALFKGWILGLLSVATGAIITLRQAYGNLADDAREAASNVWTTIVSFPDTIQQAAVETAVGELAQFDLFAGPVATGVTLSVLAVVAFTVTVLILGEDG